LPAAKSARQSLRRYHRNRTVRRTTRTTIGAALRAIELGDADAAQPAFRQAISVLDEAVKKGLLPKNNASRRKSRLAAKFNRLVSAPPQEAPALAKRPARRTRARSQPVPGQG
jgi:small subunit ribosomal protein S20